jgi:hypothetical protein
MKAKLMKAFMTICGLILFSGMLFPATGYAAPANAQQETDLVSLTVWSSCASANIRLSTGETLKTPFSKQFPRGQSVTLESLDPSLPYCGALPVVSDFRRFIVNNELLPKGQSSVELKLEKDTAVFVHYGFNDANVVTLSVWSSCATTGVNVRVSEKSIGGLTGIFNTHFDVSLLQGQSVQLEADPQLSHCGNLGAAYPFRRWTAGGKVFPEGQIVIDLPLDQHTTAVAHYGYVTPSLRLNSFQLLRNGQPVDFIRQGDKLKKYRLILQADNIQQNPQVSVDGVPAEIIRSSATEIEIKLPGKRANKTGILVVSIRTAAEDSVTPVPIEVRKEP